MPAYSVSIFLGAFLLFQVQPLIGKYILPWFGGGAGVWTTCLLFFQLLLLAGYTYAYGVARWLKPRKQVMLQLALLAAALALLPITPSDSWKPRGTESPAWQIFLLLSASLGLPFFVLSTTSPLLQHWYSTTHGGASPYRFYALSNTGSFLALVSYPFLIEPNFTRRTQAQLWGWCFGVYALGCGFCALRLWRADRKADGKAGIESVRIASRGDIREVTSTRLRWLLWPACASLLLLATTNKICQDVAVVPFLWVLPLALYLLSFMICFSKSHWYAPFPFTLVLIAVIGAVCWTLAKGSSVPIRLQLSAYAAGLFICCLVCHGELYRLKPHPQRLTEYYLLIATGGALGGLFVAVLAPHIFTSYYELHYGLFLCFLLFTVARTSDSFSAKQWRWLACALTLLVFGGIDSSLARLARQSQPLGKAVIVDLRIGVWVLLAGFILSWIVRKKFATFPYWKGMACAWLWIGVVALAEILWLQARSTNPDIIYRGRNFFGVLTVLEHQQDKPLDHHFLLQHGQITHGLQFAEHEQAKWPTSYYGEQSGIGLAVGALSVSPRRLGVVGLGTGTIAVYAEAGDYVRIYEINPEVARLATSRFTYLANCLGQVEVIPGDARLSLERELPQHFDLLALDAFNSDAIPVHLLTREAFEVYQRHINPNGIIAIHISNHYLDLEPVVMSLARRFNYKFVTIDYDEFQEDWWLYSSTWMLLTRDETVINFPAIHWAATPPPTNSATVPLWTDDFTSLFPILK